MAETQTIKNKKIKPTPEEKYEAKIKRFNKCAEIGYRLSIAGIIMSLVPFINIFIGLGLSIAGIAVSAVGTHGSVKKPGVSIGVVGTIISIVWGIGWYILFALVIV